MARRLAAWLDRKMRAMVWLAVTSMALVGVQALPSLALVPIMLWLTRCRFDRCVQCWQRGEAEVDNDNDDVMVWVTATSMALAPRSFRCSRSWR